MKVSVPLSLKVTLWLVLNLVLLGAVATTFLILQGGLGWDSLAAGPSGDRLHALATVVAGETAAASPENRDAVLARFSRVYDADLVLVRNRGGQIAGAPLAIPAAVWDRVTEGPPQPRGAPLDPREPDAAPADAPERAGPHLQARGRFVVHTRSPSSWWIGLRVPFGERSPLPTPATLLIHAHSFWAAVLLLNLGTWFLIGASVVLLSVLFWLPLVSSITRALRHVTAATERIAEGRFDSRVPSGRRDELGNLARAVNTMASRLEAHTHTQKRFLADVAHELGSPIARLQAATEILESRAGAELAPHVTDLREEVQHMAELVNELLAFTKSGLRQRPVVLTPIAVQELLPRVVDREDAVRRVGIVAPAGLNVLGDEVLLTRALGNLVRNAVRYAGDSSPIRITARREQDRVAIVVEDEGPGVSAAALPRLGEPFFRPEVARSRETGGAGLGLAIAKSSVQACGGELRFSNRKPHGLRAEVSLAGA